MSLLFNTMFRFAIVFLPRSRRILISWLQSTWFWAQENKICHYFLFSPTYLQWNDGTRCHDLCFLILVFWMLSFKPVFFTFFFHHHQEDLFLFCWVYIPYSAKKEKVSVLKGYMLHDSIYFTFWNSKIFKWERLVVALVMHQG